MSVEGCWDLGGAGGRELERWDRIRSAVADPSTWPRLDTGCKPPGRHTANILKAHHHHSAVSPLLCGSRCSCVETPQTFVLPPPLPKKISKWSEKAKVEVTRKAGLGGASPPRTVS